MQRERHGRSDDVDGTHATDSLVAHTPSAAKTDRSAQQWAHPLDGVVYSAETRSYIPTGTPSTPASTLSRAHTTRKTPCAMSTHKQCAKDCVGIVSAGMREHQHEQEQDNDDEGPAPVATLAQRFSSAPASASNASATRSTRSVARVAAESSALSDDIDSADEIGDALAAPDFDVADNVAADFTEPSGPEQRKAASHRESLLPHRSHYLQRLGIAQARTMPNYKRSPGLRAMARAIEASLESRKRPESEGTASLVLQVLSTRSDAGVLICQCSVLHSSLESQGGESAYERLVAVFDERQAEETGISPECTVRVSRPWYAHCVRGFNCEI